MTFLPQILESTKLTKFPALVDREIDILIQARKLFDAGFVDHSLLDIWTAAVHNLRRRVESYGIELFLSAVKDDAGRKKYDQDGESISERWSNVDEIVLINGATRIGLLNKKAGKALEMINWMRNHASPAHDSEAKVEREDVIGLALILQKNLFETPLPDPGQSPSGLFEPIKKSIIEPENIDILKGQIKSYKKADIRITFGFLLDLICKGEKPGYNNAKELFPTVWENANEDVRKIAGIRFHNLMFDPSTDGSADNEAKLRLLETLIMVQGVKYIPDPARARIFRKVVSNLAKAKDSSYGWSNEESAAKGLRQLGVSVPSIVFESVYQEILTVWCGNYWGRSKAHSILIDFITELDTLKILEVCRLFKNNERVKDELSYAKPKKNAVDLLNLLKSKLSLSNHITEVENIIEYVEAL